MMERKTWLKCTVITVSTIYLLCGLTLLITSGVLHETLTVVGVPPVTLIVGGSLFLIIGIFGLYAAIREHLYMVSIFEKIQWLILVAQVIIMTFAFKILADADVASEFNRSLANYWTFDSDRAFVDLTQTHFKCCGTSSAADYVTGFPGMNGTYPWSCCASDLRSRDSHRPCDPNTVYTKPCADDLFEVFHVLRKILGGISLVVALLALSTIIITRCLSPAIRQATILRIENTAIA